MLAENALDQNTHPGARRLAVLPVHGGVALQAVQQLVGDDAQMVVPHRLDRALVLGQGVVEGDLFLAQSSLLAAPVCGADVLGKPDQFLKDLRRGDGVAVVAGDRLLQPLGEGAGLYDVDPASRAKLAVEELAQRLQREVLPLHPLNLCEELFGKDGDVRRVQPGGFQNIDDFGRDDRAADDLLNGQVPLS